MFLPDLLVVVLEWLLQAPSQRGPVLGLSAESGPVLASPLQVEPWRSLWSSSLVLWGWPRARFLRVSCRCCAPLALVVPSAGNGITKVKWLWCLQKQNANVRCVWAAEWFFWCDNLHQKKYFWLIHDQIVYNYSKNMYAGFVEGNILSAHKNERSVPQRFLLKILANMCQLINIYPPPRLNCLEDLKIERF